MKPIMCVQDTKEGPKAIQSLLVTNPSIMRTIDHPLRARIVQELHKEPQYTAELAKKLELPEQNVYYHVHLLVKAGILEVIEKKEIRGTVAKRYAPTAISFTLSFDSEWKHFEAPRSSTLPSHLSQFLAPFLKGQGLDALLVVGSPDPHGPLQARARDGHYAVDLGFFLGQYIKLQEQFSVRLDIDIKAEKHDDGNLILLGGPITNMLVAEINEHLAVGFTENSPYCIHSKKTGRKYTDDAIGFIARIPNPKNKDAFIIVIAGIRAIGTKSAVLAFTRHHERILRDFDNRAEWFRVIKGIDMDGDGKIDFIDILE